MRERGGDSTTKEESTASKIWSATFLNSFSDRTLPAEVEKRESAAEYRAKLPDEEIREGEYELLLLMAHSRCLFDFVLFD